MTITLEYEDMAFFEMKKRAAYLEELDKKRGEWARKIEKSCQLLKDGCSPNYPCDICMARIELRALAAEIREGGGK